MSGAPGTHLGTTALLPGEAAASGSDAGRACRAGAQGGWQVPAGLRGTQGTVWARLGHDRGRLRSGEARPPWLHGTPPPGHSNEQDLCFHSVPPRRALGTRSGPVRLL